MRTIEIRRGDNIFQVCPEHPNYRFKGSKPDPPPPIAPTPQPIPGREEMLAKKKVKSRRGGRESNIHAGLLNTSNNDILKGKLG